MSELHYLLKKMDRFIYNGLHHFLSASVGQDVDLPSSGAGQSCATVYLRKPYHAKRREYPDPAKNPG